MAVKIFYLFFLFLEKWNRQRPRKVSQKIRAHYTLIIAEQFTDVLEICYSPIQRQAVFKFLATLLLVAESQHKVTNLGTDVI